MPCMHMAVLARLLLISLSLVCHADDHLQRTHHSQADIDLEVAAMHRWYCTEMAKEHEDLLPCKHWRARHPDASAFEPIQFVFQLRGHMKPGGGLAFLKGLGCIDWCSRSSGCLSSASEVAASSAGVCYA